MKRVLTLLLCCVLIFTAIPMSASAECIDGAVEENAMKTNEMESDITEGTSDIEVQFDASDVTDVDSSDDISEETEEETEEEQDNEEQISEEQINEEAIVTEEISQMGELEYIEDESSVQYVKYNLDGMMESTYVDEYGLYAQSVSQGTNITKAPTELSWGGGYNTLHGDIAWRKVEGANGNYTIKIEHKKEGEWENFTTVIISSFPELDGIVSFPYGRDMFESGVYRFCVAATTKNKKNMIWSDYSGEYSYIRPEQSLETSTKVWWDSEEKTKSCWEAVANSYGYQVDLFALTDGEWKRTAAYSYVGDITCYPWFRSIKENTSYAFKVRALSADIEIWANGGYSELSPIHYAGNEVIGATYAIDKALDEVETGGDYDDALKNLKELSTEELAVAIQSSSSVQELLKEFEDAYAANKNVSVTKNIGSGVEQYMDGSKISVLGAALNAATGDSEVTLNITNPTEVTQDNYRNAVKFSISVAGIPNGSQLAIPMRITLPIPSNITIQESFFIDHIHQDGSRETIYPNINGDGTASFTVTSFSDFVFSNTYINDNDIVLQMVDTGTYLPDKLSMDGRGALLRVKALGFPSLEVDANAKLETSDNSIVGISSGEGIWMLHANGKGCAIITVKSVANENIDKKILVCVNSNNDSESVIFETIPSKEVVFHALLIEDCIYSGVALKPEPLVYADTTLLTKNTDYTLSWSNNTNVAKKDATKAPTINIKGKGKYTGTLTIKFAIEPKSIASSDVIAETIETFSNGKVQEKVPVIKYGNKKLTNSRDFTCKYPESSDAAYKDPGEYQITVIGRGNYTGEIAVTERIISKVTQKSVSTLKISGIKDYAYTGNPITQNNIQVKDANSNLIDPRNYSITWSNNTEVGKATGVLVGKGDYYGKRTLSFKITGTKLSDAMRFEDNGVPFKYEYTGKEQACGVLLLCKGSDAVFGRENYTITYKNNVKAGGKNAAQMIVTGKNGYVGTMIYRYTIVKADISDLISRSVVSEPLTTDTFAYVKGGVKPQPSLIQYYNNIELKQNVDYSVTYKNYTKVTTTDMKSSQKPYLEIKGKGNYCGKIRIDYVITRQSLSKVNASAVDKAYSTRRGAELSVPKLTDIDSKVLTAGKDYSKTFNYTVVNRTQIAEDKTLLAGAEIDPNTVLPAGTLVDVEIEGLGNYTGSVKARYRITTNEISKAKVTIAHQEYTGKPIDVTGSDITITYKGVVTPLVLGTDYVILSQKNNINVGTATVTIKGIGNYSGTKEYKFSIKKRTFHWWWED